MYLLDPMDYSLQKCRGTTSKNSKPLVKVVQEGSVVVGGIEEMFVGATSSEEENSGLARKEAELGIND